LRCAALPAFQLGVSCVRFPSRRRRQEYTLPPVHHQIVSGLYEVVR